MKNKRLFASIMAVAMMLSSLPMTAVGMVSATEEAPAADEYILNMDFSNDESASFTHGARDIIYDDGTNNDGNPFIHVSALTTGDAWSCDSNLTFNTEITLEPGKYALSFDMRNGYDAVYNISGDVNATEPPSKNKDENGEDKADLELTRVDALTAKANWRNAWMKPVFSDHAKVVYPEGSGKRTAGTMAFDDTTAHGLAWGNRYEDLFCVGSEWRTATAVFTVTGTTTLNGFLLNGGNDGTNAVNCDSYDIDNITIKQLPIAEPGNSIVSIADVAPAFEAGNTYIRITSSQTGAGINVSSNVAENLGRKFDLYIDVAIDNNKIVDSENIREDYNGGVNIRHRINEISDEDGSIKAIDSNYRDITRKSGWTTIYLGTYDGAAINNGCGVMTPGTGDFVPLKFDNLKLVDHATGAVIATEDFEKVDFAVETAQVNFGVVNVEGVDYDLGSLWITKRNNAVIELATDELYDVAAFNGEENVYALDETLAPGVYTVSAKVRNDAIVTAAAVDGVNHANVWTGVGAGMKAAEVTALCESYIEAHGAGAFYRFYKGPSENYILLDNATVDVAVKATADGAVVGSADVTVGANWTDISFSFTAKEETTLDDVIFTAEPTIADTSVRFPKTLAYVGIKDVKVEKTGAVAVMNGFYFSDASGNVDIANRAADNKYIAVGNIGDGVTGRNRGFSIKFENVTEAAAGLILEYDVAAQTVVKRTAAEAQDSYAFDATIRYNSLDKASITKPISRDAWTTVAIDMATVNPYMQHGDDAYSLVNWAIDNVRLVDAYGNVVASEGSNFIVHSVNNGFTVEFPGYATVNFNTNGNLMSDDVNLVTAEEYFTAIVTDAEGGEILSDTTAKVLEPGIYEFTALVKNNETVQSSLVVGTTADAEGCNATSAWKDNDGNGKLEYSGNDNVVAKEWIAAYIEAQGGDDFYRYLAQTTEWMVKKDNNKINVTPIVKLGETVLTGDEVTVNDDDWAEVTVSFVLYENTTVTNVGFAAEHILSGKTLREYPAADYANLAFKAVAVEKVGDVTIKDGFSFPTADAEYDIANKTEDNKYISVKNIAINSGFNFATDVTAEDNVGKNLVLEYDIAVDSVIKVPAKEVQDSYNYNPTIRIGAKKADGSWNITRPAITRDAWTTVSYIYNDTFTGCYQQGNDSEAHSMVNWVIDNVRIVDVTNGRKVIFEETFDSENVTVNDNSFVVYFGTKIVDGFEYNGGTVYFNPKSLSANSVALETAEGYFTATVNDNADGTAGQVVGYYNETLVPGEYAFTALVKNNETMASKAYNGTSAEDEGMNSASAWYDHDGNGAVYSGDDVKIANELAAGYIEAQGGVGFYRYLAQPSDYVIRKDNNKIEVTPVVTLANGEVIKAKAAFVADNESWSEVMVVFTVTEETKVASVAFEAQHILSGATLYEYPAADYANLAFKNFAIAPFVCEHDYTSEITTDATCGANGVETFTCVYCGDTYTDVIFATGEHEYGYVVDVNDNNYHIVTCANCDYMMQEAHNNGDDDACDYCGHVDAPEVDPTVYVAEIDGVQYETLAAAIDAANRGATIDLIDNAEAVTVAKPVTINMNGFAAEITVDGTTYDKGVVGDTITVYPLLTAKGSASLLLEEMIQINYKTNGNTFLPYGFTQADILANGKIIVFTGAAVSDDAAYLYVEDTDLENSDYQIIDLTYASGSGTSAVYQGNTAGIPAKNMGDVQKYRYCITDADGVVWYTAMREYSAKDYCYNQFNKSNTAAKLKTLVADILNYGTAAQIYFKYKTDALMNSELTGAYINTYKNYTADMASVLKTGDTSKFAITFTDGLEKGTTSLSLEGAININVKTQLQSYTNGTASLVYWSEATYNSGAVLSEANADGIIPFEGTTIKSALIEGIPAKSLGNTWYYCIKVELNGEVHYGALRTTSAHQYCVNQINKASNATALKDLCKAIIIYSNSAAAQFNK